MAREANMQVINWDIARQKLKQREQDIASPPEWIDIHEVCRRYSTSISSINRSIKRGRFPQPSRYVAKGKRYWNVAEIENMMKSRQDNEL